MLFDKLQKTNYFIMNSSSGKIVRRRRFSLSVIFLPKLYFLLRSTNSLTVQMYCTGLPPTAVLDCTDFVTSEPAATSELSPISYSMHYMRPRPNISPVLNYDLSESIKIMARPP